MNILNNNSIGIANTKRCPKCGWETNNGGFTCSFDGFKGDFCLKCYAKKVTEGVPELEEIISNSN